MTPPEILIRPYTLDDVEAAYGIYSDPEVMRWIGDGSVIQSLEAMRTRIEDRIRHEEETGFIRVWAVCQPETKELIGSAIYGHIPHSEAFADEPQEYEIGWHLARAWWGRGCGTAIGLAMLARAAEDQRPVVAVAYPENKASVRIMEKIGMEPRGLTDRFYDIAGVVLYVKGEPPHNQGIPLS